MDERPIPTEFEELLEAEPWLRPFIEPDDPDLEPARRRFDEAERAAKVRMER